MAPLFVFIPSPRATWDEAELYTDREVAWNRMLRSILYEMWATRGAISSRGFIEWYESGGERKLVYHGTYCAPQVEHRVWSYAKKNNCHLRDAVDYYVRRPQLLYNTNVLLLRPEERRPSKL